MIGKLCLGGLQILISAAVFCSISTSLRDRSRFSRSTILRPLHWIGRHTWQGRLISRQCSMPACYPQHVDGQNYAVYELELRNGSRLIDRRIMEPRGQFFRRLFPRMLRRLSTNWSCFGRKCIGQREWKGWRTVVSMGLLDLVWIDFCTAASS